MPFFFFFFLSTFPIPRVWSGLNNFLLETRVQKDLPVVQWLRLQAPKAGGPGSIPGQGTRPYMPIMSFHAANKDLVQPNKQILKSTQYGETQVTRETRHTTLAK